MKTTAFSGQKTVPVFDAPQLAHFRAERFKLREAAHGTFETLRAASLKLLENALGEETWELPKLSAETLARYTAPSAEAERRVW